MSRNDKSKSLCNSNTDSQVGLIKILKNMHIDFDCLSASI